VRLRVDCCGDPTHEVPDVKTHGSVGPVRMNHLAHLLTTAVSVHVDEHWGIHRGGGVAVLKTLDHTLQSPSFMGGEDTHEHLTVLVAHVGGPGGSVSGFASQLLRDLLKNKQKSE